MAHANPWLERRVIAYAHQGGAWEGPSSTLHAIGQAVAAGSTAVELDVHATADGELVVCHDATVDRTTDGSGRIAEMTLAELRALDNAYWFVPGVGAATGYPDEAYVHRGRAPDDPAFRVPALREVLGAFPDVTFNLDIKQTSPEVVPYEKELARVLAEFDRADDVIVASFADRATEAFRQIGTGVAVSAGSEATAAFWRAVHAGTEPPATDYVALQVPERRAGLVVVDEALVDGAHRQGVAVHVWTVNEPAAMARLLELGVDGIITDVPSQLAALLEERGATWTGGRRTS